MSQQQQQQPQPKPTVPTTMQSQAPTQISLPSHQQQPQPTIVSAPTSLQQLSTSTGTISTRPVMTPTSVGTSPSVPGQVRPGEYLVLLAPPGTRQPGVQSIRYPFMPIQRHQLVAAPGATILQRPALIRGITQAGINVHPNLIPTSQPFSYASMPTAMGGPSPIIRHGNVAVAAPSQMTVDQALEKGTNFFNSLLTNEVMSPAKKAVIQTLIQDLIDSKKTPEEFATALQKELNSGPQTQLAPFLNLLLPNLRHSLTIGQTKLPGIRPPNQLQTSNLSPQIIIPSSRILPAPSPSTSATPTSIVTAKDGLGQTTSPSAPATQKKKKTPLPPGQKSAYAIKKEAREARKREKELAAMNIKLEKSDERQENKADSSKTEKAPPKPKSDKPKQPKQKKQDKQLESLSATLRDDDDVNDVAAMGGVNLAEESQKIMASGAELVGTQIRSCKDQPFFDPKSLSSKISRIVGNYNLPEPSNDVITIISHATQERLKDIVERLGILAEHRSENLKFNPKYDISNDIKGQMKFLAELDRIEKRRYEERERELLLRVAKSRSKVEDPEQQKLREKAKNMQRAEQEEVRQREANQTALLALGPRKKLKTSSSSSVSAFSQSMGFGSEPKSFSDNRSEVVKRVKRVNMRDLQVLFELDRVHLDRLVKVSVQ